MANLVAPNTNTGNAFVSQISQSSNDLSEINDAINRKRLSEEPHLPIRTIIARMSFADVRVQQFLAKNNIPEQVQGEFMTFTMEVLKKTSKKDLQEIAGKGAGYNIHSLLHFHGGESVDDSGMKYWADMIRYIFATILTIISIGLICYSIGAGLAAMPGHPIILYILLAFDIVLLAYLEGLQIAILALERTSCETFIQRKRAYASQTLAMRYNGHNVQRFLVGRQFFVVFVVFLCAQLTTYADLDIPWMPEWMFVALIQTGLPGALIVLAFGQLCPQLIATTNPITFMNLPGTWSVIQLCLYFESTGVTHFSWVLAMTTRYLFSMGDHEHIEDPNKDEEMNVIEHIPQNVRNMMKTVKISASDLDALYSERSTGHVTNPDLGNLACLKGLHHQGNMPNQTTIVRHLVQNKKRVPRCLLPRYNKLHIPAHLVASEYIRRVQTRQQSTNNVERKTFAA